MSNTSQPAGRRPPFKVIGILGGMGAAASVDFEKEVLALLQDGGAKVDLDYPWMRHFCMSLDGFDETGFTNEDLVREQLLWGIQDVARDSDFVVVPCNTVHHFEDDMRAAINVPLVSILDAVTDRAAEYRKVGLLTSSCTRRYRLYEERLTRRDVAFVGITDDEQTRMNGVIDLAISGKNGAVDMTGVRAITDRLVAEGAEAIILGCTELPMAIKEKHASVPLLNSTRILAEATVRFARRN